MPAVSRINLVHLAPEISLTSFRSTFLGREFLLIALADDLHDRPTYLKSLRNFPAATRGTVNIQRTRNFRGIRWPSVHGKLAETCSILDAFRYRKVHGPRALRRCISFTNDFRR